MEELLNRLKQRFTIEKSLVQRQNLAFITVPRIDAVALLTHLRDIERYAHLVFLTAVDQLERGIFQLTYMLHNYDTHTDLGVYVEIERENAGMESIHHLWAQAATYQRELKEMFGIDFPGSPRVDEAFILEGWHDMPPMRREFDTLDYSEKTYFPRPGRTTRDPREHMKEQLYPKDVFS